MQWFKDEKNRALADCVTAEENLPFLLQPELPEAEAVILIHGFGSSPRELLPLGQHLVKHNITVYGVRLPGHGTSPEDLANRTAQEWLSVCQRGYLSLLDSGFQVIAAGLSTGALLSLKLALLYPLKRQVLLAPFLKFQHPFAAAAKLLSLLISYQKIDLPQEEQPYYYSLRPLKGIAQINQLRWQLARELDQVTVPTLVLTSTGDKTVAPGTAKDLFNKLGSPEKFIHSYGMNVPHVLTSNKNPELQDVLKRCCDFLTR